QLFRAGKMQHPTKDDLLALYHDLIERYETAMKAQEESCDSLSAILSEMSMMPQTAHDQKPDAGLYPPLLCYRNHLKVFYLVLAPNHLDVFRGHP
ncbi:MAG: hypothetical protein ABF446_09120, partial [Acetobacter orientalis]|uniref:hypothetical protein n=1 Tax=Acetobacter orientalis TaxID=146474 RepID=UPI0039E8655A